MSKPSFQPLKTEQLMSRLALRFSGPEWAFLPQVPDSTGIASRTADAIAMSLWHSRGMEIHGLELKADRADWLREMKNPAKAEVICRYCDRWWIVAGSPEIVKDEELPPTWGLLIPRGEALVCRVKAPKLRPMAADRAFLAALLRRAVREIVPKSPIGEQLNDEYSRGYQNGAASATVKIERKQAEEQSLRATISTFEQASGLSIRHWNAGSIGCLARLICGGEHGFAHEELAHRLRDLRRDMEGMTAQISTALDQWTAVIAQSANAEQPQPTPVAAEERQPQKKTNSEKQS